MFDDGPQFLCSAQAGLRIRLSGVGGFLALSNQLSFRSGLYYHLVQGSCASQ